ncbi:heme biosynthesis HemY N-terminal domain-containing protein [Pseudoalteromonas sp. H105]|uniref:heme biosynthesis HemY N-terminal domain-containing protein n=1 Tax=Pseudoalteromonas sp. H105 TaxID=1348393 RepID=UPI000732085E|nr:heme biosynthesis HemY N-terminal domain-containing protein [Pseudoalteromonas sp. H105]KTF13804.1 heme biosynthesis protein [Pseudoalteromonas sp. H105]
MIRLILVILAIAVLLAVSPMLIGEVGYVLISFNQTTIEGSIVAFFATFIVIALGLYLTYKLIRYVWSLYSHTRHRFFARSEERKHAALEQGVWGLVNGDYEQLELALDNNSVAEPWQDVRYAMLAKAALQSNNASKAIDCLDKISPANQLKAAKLWLASGDSSAVTGELKALAESKKATALELKSYAEVLVQQQKWASLEQFMPRLLSKKALTESQWQVLFAAYFNAQSALTEKYHALSKHLRAKAHFAYLSAMAQSGRLSEIELTLLKMLKKPSDQDQLAQILKVSAPGDALKLQANLQDALKKQPENQSLLLALACLANAHGEYDLAARVFDKALTVDNQKEYLIQAQLSYSKSAQPQKALDLYL